MPLRAPKTVDVVEKVPADVIEITDKGVECRKSVLLIAEQKARPK